MTRPHESATSSESAQLEMRLRQIGGKPDAEIDLGETGLGQVIGVLGGGA